MRNLNVQSVFDRLEIDDEEFNSIASLIRDEVSDLIRHI